MPEDMSKEGDIPTGDGYIVNKIKPNCDDLRSYENSLQHTLGVGKNATVFIAEMESVSKFWEGNNHKKQSDPMNVEHPTNYRSLLTRSFSNEPESWFELLQSKA